tara:strand:- start:409 stop:1011 length:603 start_codon:yes stop_codon:yes gene_type:complete
MTPRLKLLSALLCLSIVYAVYDYIDRNNIGKGKELQKKAKIKRARTAGTSANSAKVRRIKAREKKLKKNIINQKQNKENINNNIADFNEIAYEYASLDGWSRNPFVDVYEPKPIASIKIPEKNIQMVQKEIAKEETFELNALDRLNIETAVRMGEKAFVTINGKTFREGDLINDALIEKIENEQITFKVGTTRIIKNVGI